MNSRKACRSEVGQPNRILLVSYLAGWLTLQRPNQHGPTLSLLVLMKTDMPCL